MEEILDDRDVLMELVPIHDRFAVSETFLIFIQHDKPVPFLDVAFGVDIASAEIAPTGEQPFFAFIVDDNCTLCLLSDLLEQVQSHP